MRKLMLTSCVMVVCFAMPSLTTMAQAGELPKCRNVSGYEPKAVCSARNQRAQWQAEYTAKVTAQLMAQVIAQQAAEAKANEKGIMDTVTGIGKGFADAIRGLF